MRTNKFAHLAFFLLAALSMTGCGEKEDSTEPVNHNTYKLEKTTWEGTYNAPVEAPDGSTIPFTLQWTMEFATNDSGLLLCDISSQVSQPQSQEIAFTYSVDGSTGHFFVDGQEDTFSIDWSNNRISMDLQIPIDIGTGRIVVGGMTNLYRIM